MRSRTAVPRGIAAISSGVSGVRRRLSTSLSSEVIAVSHSAAVPGTRSFRISVLMASVSPEWSRMGCVENSTVDCAERKALARFLAFAIRAALAERFDMAVAEASLRPAAVNVFSKVCTTSIAPFRCLRGSQVFFAKPRHLTRYFTLFPFPILSVIASTSKVGSRSSSPGR